MLFTIKDLQYKLGVSERSLRVICKKNKIQGVVKPIPNQRSAQHFNYDQVEKIKVLAKSMIDKKVKKIEKEEVFKKQLSKDRLIFKRIGGIDPLYTVYEGTNFRGVAKQSYLMEKGLLKICE